MQKGLKLLEIAVGELKPYKKNARTHSDEQIEQICASIREFGFLAPVLVSKDMEIIAGHGRVAAAKRMGMETVPCVLEEHLTEEQRRAYVLADNRLAEQAGWDFELVGEELAALDAAGFDIDLTGFDESFLPDTAAETAPPPL